MSKQANRTDDMSAHRRAMHRDGKTSRRTRVFRARLPRARGLARLSRRQSRKNFRGYATRCQHRAVRQRALFDGLDERPAPGGAQRRSLAIPSPLPRRSLPIRIAHCPILLSIKGRRRSISSSRIRATKMSVRQKQRSVAKVLHDAARGAPGNESILSVTAFSASTLVENWQMSSNGFSGTSRGTSYSIGAQVSAKDADGRRPEEYDYASSRYLAQHSRTQTASVAMRPGGRWRASERRRPKVRR